VFLIKKELIEKMSLKQKKRIPFNVWSKERIRQGRKFCTSRHNRYKDDDRVYYITPLLPFWLIKEYLWKVEGADSPFELRKVMEEIYGREVLADEKFYVHFGNFSDEVFGEETLEEHEKNCSFCKGSQKGKVKK